MATFRGMDLSVSVEGIPEAVRRLREVPRKVDTKAAASVRGACMRIVRRAKQLVPVRTGALQRNITYRLSGTRGYVGIAGTEGPAIYWRFVEFGTVKSAARPFKTDMMWRLREIETEA
jgi:HK97 gp10 family phage protein